uniref:Secreted protein n=1 Tax=Gibberella zeae TaxID=5518 RepID=A0A4E9EGS5_GIBZA
MIVWFWPILSPQVIRVLYFRLAVYHCGLLDVRSLPMLHDDHLDMLSGCHHCILAQDGWEEGGKEGRKSSWRFQSS